MDNSAGQSDTAQYKLDSAEEFMEVYGMVLCSSAVQQ